MPKRLRTIPPACPPKTPLTLRPLLTESESAEIGALFEMLSNGTRLRLLHALARSGELCVTDLAAEIGMKPQAVSNQIRRLADRRILGSRRNGLNVLYRVIDPCVTTLLDRGLCLVEDAQVRRERKE